MRGDIWNVVNTEDSIKKVDEVVDHVVVVDNKEKEKVWWTRSPR